MRKQNTKNYLKIFNKSMHINGIKIEEIRFKDNIFIGRIFTNETTFILKYFYNKKDRIEISNYKFLQKNNIQTLRIYFYGKSYLIMEDVLNSTQYRLANESDLNNPLFIKNIAKWYRDLHNLQSKNLKSSYNECNLITKKNINKLNNILNNNQLIQILQSKVSKIKKLNKKFSYTINYNDFSYENMIVGLNNSFMFDYNLLGTGYIYSDIKNIEDNLNHKNYNLFKNEYGVSNFDISEINFYNITSPLIALIVASNRKIFPNWAKSILDNIKSPSYIKLLNSI